MDVQQISMTMAQADLMNKVSASVMGKVLDSFESAGQGVIKMINEAPTMEHSVSPHLGSTIDIRV